jgi:hypothetical protein
MDTKFSHKKERGLERPGAFRRVSTTLRQVLTEFSELFMFVEPAC